MAEDPVEAVADFLQGSQRVVDVALHEGQPEDRDVFQLDHDIATVQEALGFAFRLSGAPVDDRDAEDGSFGNAFFFQGRLAD